MLKNNRGTTLLELVVSLGIFVIIMLLSTAIFQSVMTSQKRAIVDQNIQENLRFAFELMSKEMRGASGDRLAAECVAAADNSYKVFNTLGGAQTGDKLFFKNSQGECVAYEIDNYRLKITRYQSSLPGTKLSLYATPEDLKISRLYFYIDDDEFDAFHTKQPQVTMVIEAETYPTKQELNKKIIMQTSISSRYYE